MYERPEGTTSERECPAVQPPQKVTNNQPDLSWEVYLEWKASEYRRPLQQLEPRSRVLTLWTEVPGMVPSLSVIVRLLLKKYRFIVSLKFPGILEQSRE